MIWILVSIFYQQNNYNLWFFILSYKTNSWACKSVPRLANMKSIQKCKNWNGCETFSKKKQDKTACCNLEMTKTWKESKRWIGGLKSRECMFLWVGDIVDFEPTYSKWLLHACGCTLNSKLCVRGMRAWMPDIDAGIEDIFLIIVAQKIFSPWYNLPKVRLTTL